MTISPTLKKPKFQLHSEVVGKDSYKNPYSIQNLRFYLDNQFLEYNIFLKKCYFSIQFLIFPYTEYMILCFQEIT